VLNDSSDFTPVSLNITPQGTSNAGSNPTIEKLKTALDVAVNVGFIVGSGLEKGPAAVEEGLPALEADIPALEPALNKAGQEFENIVSKLRGAGEAIKDGEFSIINWENYPEKLPQPEGTFRLIQGDEYDAARAAANRANQSIHAADPSLKGMQIHEIQPIKFDGSPTDIANKIPLSPEHAGTTTWWRMLQRGLEK